ncbi:uncharacterized protein N7483_003091 [Penicillium malachiteum]|uniref:uncharacterized protein n=1 Tax=Penicillium malachiteum TaxID=1324776 RepID=UPI002549B78C|nr:uncharacterized protein N7483_003091 [Penicillium malachiteum]KAJ5728583.1 hypothetical protein N7483_003091 [Penicillium malachiteum]
MNLNLESRYQDSDTHEDHLCAMTSVVSCDTESINLTGSYGIFGMFDYLEIINVNSIVIIIRETKQNPNVRQI